MTKDVPPVTLAKVREVAAGNPLAGLVALDGYLEGGEAKLAEARALRVELVRVARAQSPPVPWPRLVAATGVSETYLRREMERAEK